LASPHVVVYQSVTELAEAAQVGEASVIRLCRDLGFKGFQDFKLALAADVALAPEISPHATPLQRVTEAALRAVSETSAMLAGALEPALEVLAATRTLLVCGVGASGVSAQDYGYKFVRLGYGVTVYTDAHLAAMAAATLPKGAALIALTRSGSTLDTVKVLELARARGVTTLLVTERAKSPATAAADITLLTASNESTLTGGSIPSKIGQLLVLDALFAELLARVPGAPEAVAATAGAVADRNI
jgi:DNA-binding MurR/RpiR family transcriptional regulator